VLFPLAFLFCRRVLYNITVPVATRKKSHSGQERRIPWLNSEHEVIAPFWIHIWKRLVNNRTTHALDGDTRATANCVRQQVVSKRCRQLRVNILAEDHVNCIWLLREWGYLSKPPLQHICFSHNSHERGSRVLNSYYHRFEGWLQLNHGQPSSIPLSHLLSFLHGQLSPRCNIIHLFFLFDVPLFHMLRIPVMFLDCIPLQKCRFSDDASEALQ